jgi:hypothetical protein
MFVTLLALDAACYLLLPNRIARKFDGYRVVPDSAKDAVRGGAGYPRGYFTSHTSRGFDIKPGARGNHSVDGVTYSIWSNSLGCFDHEWQPVPVGYYYFAGDSSTWGYTPYEQKFATLFEKRTGIPSLKCGVPHTGELHEFDKFKDIVRRVGVPPKHVIVAYSSNDIANDYVYPHSTVVDGWLVDDVFLDSKNYGRVHVDRDWIKGKMAEALAPRRESLINALWGGAKAKIRQCSISAHVFSIAVRRARTALGLDSVEPSGGVPYNDRLVRNLYSLYDLYVQGGKLRYANTEFTAANRRVLMDWRDHAKVNGYQLTFLLVSYREIHENVGFWAELKEFMRANDMDYIDLGEEFRTLGAEADQVYWAIDGHMSPGGNKLVADTLVRRLANPASHNRSDIAPAAVGDGVN